MKESNSKTTSSRASGTKAEKSTKTSSARSSSTSRAKSGTTATASRSNNPEGHNQYTKNNQKK